MKTLTKYIEGISGQFVYNASPPTNRWFIGGVSGSGSSAGDWVQIFGLDAISAEGESQINLIGQSVIDLAGMTAQEKTLFFSGASTTDASFVTMNFRLNATSGPILPASAGSTVLVTDIMTSVPIFSEESLLELLTLHQAGFPGSEVDYQHIVYGTTKRYVMETITGALASPVLIDIQQRGSGHPQASDSIYCYKLVSIIWNSLDPNTQRLNFSIPATRFSLRAEAKEEPDHVRIMRLKRQYDLFQLNDRD